MSNFHQHLVLRSLNSPPILNLIYNYDENGVLRKQNQDLNETVLDKNQELAFPSANMTLLWYLRNNGSIEMENLVDLQDVFSGKKMLIDFSAILCNTKKFFPKNYYI